MSTKKPAEREASGRVLVLGVDEGPIEYDTVSSPRHSARVFFDRNGYVLLQIEKAMLQPGEPKSDLHLLGMVRLVGLELEFEQAPVPDPETGWSRMPKGFDPDTFMETYEALT